MQNQDVIVGVFNSGDEANRAMEALRQAGFADERMGFLMRGEKPGPETFVGGIGRKVEEGVAEGGVAGSIVGGVAGALAAGLIPGIGPVIAAGILSSVLAGAVGGGTAGTILGGLLGLGVPAQDAEYYHQEFRAGRAIVAVHANGRADEARDILGRFGGFDVHQEPEGAAYRAELNPSPVAPPTPIRREADVEAHHLTEPGAPAGHRIPFYGERAHHEPPPAQSGSPIQCPEQPMQSWSEVMPEYRAAWEAAPECQGRNWSEIEAAYRFAYEELSNPRFAGEDYGMIEPDLAREWQPAHPNLPWDQVRSYVYDVWWHRHHAA